MADHKIRKMLHADICVTVNSDDPAYFGGYLTANHLTLSDKDVGVRRPENIQLTKHLVQASFLNDSGKARLLTEMERFAMQYLLLDLDK